MPAFMGKAPYAPEYASYNWIGAPSNYRLTTNQDLGGNSRTFLDSRHPMTKFHMIKLLTTGFCTVQAPKI